MTGEAREVCPLGATVLPSGRKMCPLGATVLPSGRQICPLGATVLPSGRYRMSPSSVKTVGGRAIIPSDCFVQILYHM